MVFIEQITIPELSGETLRRLFVYAPEELGPEEDAYVDDPESPCEEEEEPADMPADQEEEEFGEPERRYPVLYMFDGHNVFFDETATYGKCWGMKEFLDTNHVPLIVVGVECNHEGLRRLEEYSPYTGTIVGDPISEAQGKVTMDWMVNHLKPIIDDAFPTLPDREHTAIAGSSMGGLMALFAGTVYNSVFSRAACLSPCVSIDLPALLEDIKESTIGADTRIYMDLGSVEMGRRKRFYRDMERVEKLLFSKGALPCLRLVPGGTHSEASWEKQIPFFLGDLGLLGE